MPATAGFPSKSLIDHWWVLVLRGLVAIAFGVLAALLPQITIVVLILLFAVFVFLDGVFSLASAAGRRDWAWQLLIGLLSIVLGVLMALWPVSAGFALAMVIAAWAIVRGVFDIAAAITLRHQLESRVEWVLIVSGIVSIVFGFFVATWPVLGALAIIGVTAGFAIFLGITLVAAGLRLRSLRGHRLGPPAGQAT